MAAAAAGFPDQGINMQNFQHGDCTEAPTSIHANQKMKHSSDSSDIDGFPYDAVERLLLLSGHSSSDFSSQSPPVGMVAESPNHTELQSQ